MNKGKDTDEVCKVILTNSKEEILFLVKKSGKLDLPGGHIQKGETLLKGLFREVEEETSITLKKAVFYKKVENTNYFFAKYNNDEIKISDEHKSYKFVSKRSLDLSDKYQKIAHEISKKGKYTDD